MCLQAALDAFEADSYSDLVGLLSTSCVAGIEDSEMAAREEYLKSLLPTGRDSGSDGAAPQLPDEQRGEQDDDEVEGDARRTPIADIDLVVGRQKGRKIGVKGRIIEVEPHLWNIVSPTGARPSADAPAIASASASSTRARGASIRSCLRPDASPASPC